MARSRARHAAPAFLATALAAAVLAAGCSRAEGPLRCGEIRKAPAPAAAGLVVLLNDTTRRDRLGIHGGPAATPRFDAFARESLWFRRATTQAPWTKPSVATLFTSLLPTQHGVTSHPAANRRAGEELGRPVTRSDRLDPAAETLAEAFRAAGFRTAAFVANPWLDRRFGFDQGFETYDDSFARWDAPGFRVVSSALAWLDALPEGERFLLYVHTVDTHRPYPPVTWREAQEALAKPPLDGELPLDAAAEISKLLHIEGRRPKGASLPADPRILRRSYDKGVEEFDAALGELLRGIEKSPRAGRIGVVVTSDHGEALYDRGYGNHGLGLYDDELAVPLAMRLPGTAAGEVECGVGLVDVMPTLCDWAGVACPSAMTGRSVFSGEAGREDLADHYVAQSTILDPRSRGIHRGRWKLIYQPGRRPEASPAPSPWSLFDLAADPAERRDLLAAEPRAPEAEAAFASLRTLVEQEAAPAAGVLSPGESDVDPGLHDRLKALGYVE